jgi:hypothetical protein
MNARLTRLTMIAAIAALLVGSVGPSSVAHRNAWPRNVDLTASAHPGPAGATVTDEAFNRRSAGGWQVKADTTAVSSSTCDGCAGAAQSLQILYVPYARDVTLDNAAIAWSQCRDCRAGALSVQVVVVRAGSPITANNRASAANVACEGCTTAAAAYQLVVVGKRFERLSPWAVRELRAWVDEQAQALTNPPAADLQRSLAPSETDGESAAEPTEEATSALEDLVNDDLGTATLSLEVDREGQ